MAAQAFYRQVLTGGGSTALDNIAGASLADGDIAFVMTGSALYCYRVDASSGAGESSPNIIAPDTPSGSERWILQSVQNVQTPEYENITTSTSLAVAKTYNDSSGTNTHTLPLLSGTSAGETINLYISGTDRTIIINEHATDGGTEVWTGYAIGDHVTLVSDGSAWMVTDEYSTVYTLLVKTANQTLTTTAAAIYAVNYSATVDVGNWHNISTDRFVCGYDCNVTITATSYEASSSGYASMHLYKNGAVLSGTASSSNAGTAAWTYDFSAGDYIEIYGDFYSGSGTIVGTAGGTASNASFKVNKRNR